VSKYKMVVFIYKVKLFKPDLHILMCEVDMYENQPSMSIGNMVLEIVASNLHEVHSLAL
jgi:hypothetical protein